MQLLQLSYLLLAFTDDRIKLRLELFGIPFVSLSSRCISSKARPSQPLYPVLTALQVELLELGAPQVQSVLSPAVPDTTTDVERRENENDQH